MILKAASIEIPSRTFGNSQLYSIGSKLIEFHNKKWNYFLRINRKISQLILRKRMIVAQFIYSRSMMILRGYISRYLWVGYSFYPHFFTIPILISVCLLFADTRPGLLWAYGALNSGPMDGEIFVRTFGADSLARFNGKMPQTLRRIGWGTNQAPWLLRWFFSAVLVVSRIGAGFVGASE